MYHPQVNRRVAIQAGSVGLLGLGMNHLDPLVAMASEDAVPATAKSVIYIFLSGGLAQHESFDPKPDAPEDVRGEFKPIQTQTPGVLVSEHLPLLAQRSNHWAILRSLTHPYNEHSEGHHVMLTGRNELPRGFSGSRPNPTDHPCIASMVSNLLPRRNNLPPAAVLPEKLVHVTGRTIPGQFGGTMGADHDPWFIEASQFKTSKYIHGAFPEYGFQRWEGANNPQGYKFEAPRLELHQGMLKDRFQSRLALLNGLDKQRRNLDKAAQVGQFNRFRSEAASLLTGKGVHQALNVHSVDDKLQEKYGKNTFGWSLLMARQLVEAGVRMVQVNLGNDESWDTHENAFTNLKDFLLPPTDRAVSALLDDLQDRGMLDETLIVMAGEFGRTPRVFTFDGAKSGKPGRDHWGAVQSVFFAGGGIRGGSVVGASDRQGGFPAADPHTPEDMAATIYSALGLPKTVAWYDKLNRPHQVYHGSPIRELL